MSCEELTSITRRYLEALSEEARDVLGGRRPPRFNRVTRVLLFQLCAERELLLSYLKETGLIPSSAVCANCGKDMTYKNKPKLNDGVTWDCGKRSKDGRKCNGSKSVRHSSWFSGSRMPIGKIVLLTYDILERVGRREMCAEYDVDAHTVSEWTSWVREAMVEHVEARSERVGGEGVVVEVGESGGRGGGRLLGGAERDGGRVFLVPVHDGSPAALLALLEAWLLPGTLVYWKRYDGLTADAFPRHGLRFLDTRTDSAQNFLPSYSTTKGTFQNLGHFLFNKLVQTEKGDVFLTFLNIVRQIDWTERRTTLVK